MGSEVVNTIVLITLTGYALRHNVGSQQVHNFGTYLLPTPIILFLRFQRPAWSTATLITFSFLCGIFAAVFIWRGGKKTKRVQEVEKRLRAALEGVDHQESRRITEKAENEPVVEEIMLVPPIKQKDETPSRTQ